MRAALLVLVLTAPVPALALQATCRFETRCAQTAPCVPDDLVLQLASGPMEMSALLIAPDETAIGEVGLAGNGAVQIAARGPSGVQLLTIAPDAVALYTRHLAEGPIAVTRLGRCEDT